MNALDSMDSEDRARYTDRLREAADILGIQVQRPMITEMAALGAAYLAGLGVGFWSGTEELVKNWRVEKALQQMKMQTGMGLHALAARADAPATTVQN